MNGKGERDQRRDGKTKVRAEGVEGLEELEEYTDEEKSQNYGLPCPTVGGLSGSVSICKIYL